MARYKKWTRAEAVHVFEILIESGCDLISSEAFRKHLSRDGNLIANQMIREGNGNIAYRSVDFQIPVEMSDEIFWGRIEQTPYNDLIEDNAAVAMLKMAEKFNFFEKK